MFIGTGLCPAWAVRSLCALCTAIVAVAPSLAQSGDEAEQPAGRSILASGYAIAEAMDLEAYTLQTLVISEGEIGKLVTTIDVDGATWTLDLETNSLRSDDFQVLTEIEGGELVEVEPPPVSTYRGTVREFPAAVVRGSYWDGELRAIVVASDRAIGIQPLSEAEIVGEPDVHIVYDAADSLGLHEGFCGVTDLHRVASGVELGGPQGRRAA